MAGQRYQGGGGYQHGQRGLQQRSPDRREEESVDPGFRALLDKIDLRQPSPALFDGDAEQIAKTLHQGRSNKSSQIRRFYDELLRHRASAGDDAQFTRELPFIRMLNAKAAYAGARKSEGGTLVDANFKAFLRALLGKVDSRATLANACTLFEAVIGFSPRN